MSKKDIKKAYESLLTKPYDTMSEVEKIIARVYIDWVANIESETLTMVRFTELERLYELLIGDDNKWRLQ